MIDENNLHGMGRRIGSAGGGITIRIEKKAEMAGELKVYIYLIMDALLNIPDGTFDSTKHQENSGVTHAGPHMMLFVALNGVGKMHLQHCSLGLTRKRVPPSF